MSKRELYPFTAIVGQEDMKKALILNVINPALGGVLIRGEKGTAKSTAVRAVAALLPERLQVENCPLSCDSTDPRNLCNVCIEAFKTHGRLSSVNGKMKVVDLPVSATEDRVVGTLDIEHAIKKGEKKFEPGILAEANRNILYVDEVNLLDDHVVDVLLDAAAMGVNTIEREGVSYAHPSKFILVGTMNPEEGDLRPQLLDRFGMVVDVTGEKDQDSRVEVIKRRIAFEDNKSYFESQYQEEQKKLSDQIMEAKKILPKVQMNDKILSLAAKIGIKMEVDGHRADISMIKTAMTIAALRGSTSVNDEDIIEAARLVLPHRLRRRPFEDGTIDLSQVESIVREIG